MTTAIPSSARSGPAHQSTFWDQLQDVARRMDIFERTSRLNSASIGTGGLRIYGGGAMTWYDNNLVPTAYCPELLDLTDLNGTSHLAFRIYSPPTDLTDFSDSTFQYFYPYEGYCDPVVSLGRCDDPDGTGDSHGIEVRIHADGSRAFHASKDGLVLGRFDKDDINDGTTRVLRSISGQDDFFNLYCDDNLPMARFMHIFVTSGAEHSCSIDGGVDTGSAGGTFDVTSRIELIGGGTAGVRIKDTAGALAPLYCSAVNPPSSETIKEIHGPIEDEHDALADVIATPITRFSYLQAPSAAEVAEAEATGQPVPQPTPEDAVRIGPTAESLPEYLQVLAPLGDGEEPTLLVDFFSAHWTLWRAVQQQQVQIDALTERIEQLETVG